MQWCRQEFLLVNEEITAYISKDREGIGIGAIRAERSFRRVSKNVIAHNRAFNLPLIILERRQSV